MTESVTLLGSTQGQMNMTGDAVKADGWYSFIDGLHTIAIYVQNFTGRVSVQASLALEPQEQDWFDIQLTSSTSYVEFPLVPNNPTGQNGGDTGCSAYTFKVNALWLRARMDREYLGANNDPDTISQLGVVSQILLSR
jgi:hypothetical protein